MIWKLRQAGVPGAQIAALYGVTKHAIYRRLRTYKTDAYAELREKERERHQEAHNELVRLHQQGYSADDIRDIVGCSQAALDSWRHRNSVYVKRKQELAFDLNEAWDHFTDGMATGRIATRYGVHRIAVVRAFKKHHPKEYKDIASKRKGGAKRGARLRVNSWDVETAYAAYLSGESQISLGRRYGKDRGTIQAAFVTHYGEDYRKNAAEKLATHLSSSGNRQWRAKKFNRR